MPLEKRPLSRLRQGFRAHRHVDKTGRRTTDQRWPEEREQGKSETQQQGWVCLEKLQETPSHAGRRVSITLSHFVLREFSARRGSNHLSLTFKLLTRGLLFSFSVKEGFPRGPRPVVFWHDELSPSFKPPSDDSGFNSSISSFSFKSKKSGESSK